MQILGPIPFFLFVFWLFYLLIKYRLKKKKQLQRIKEAFLKDVVEGLSFERVDYIIDKRSFDRSNPTERRFKRKFHFELLDIFQNSCANCFESAVKFELDHFFIPKSKGGNLMMRHRSGYWVCNALPLCHKCNQRKKDLPVEQFFDEKKVEHLKEKIGEISWHMNGFIRVDE